MAEIQPFKGWRYNPDLNVSMEELTSPLFDVVSDRHRARLYQNSLNSIHLSVPQPPDPALKAKTLLASWKETGILQQDKLPGIYVYYQYFTLPGTTREYCRKGFITNIHLTDWSEKIILRHENTIPASVNDRIELLIQTELNVSPTHGLYSDPLHQLEAFMDEAIKQPVYETEDYQGVRDVLGIIHDYSVIKRFQEVLHSQPVILADGHHRYEGSLAYWHQMRNRPEHTGKEGYNYHMMYLTNTESDDLVILPTHRLISGIDNFNPDSLMSKLAIDFDIRPIEAPELIPEIIAGKPHAFGLLFQDQAYKIKLKPDKIPQMSWPFPDAIKELDLTIMHYFIIEKGLGIPGKDQRKSSHLKFDRSFSDAQLRVARQESQLAIITNGVTIDEVKSVCMSGYTMPQKSTYFYPKVMCGFVFSSIKDSEFNLPAFHPFAL